MESAVDAPIMREAVERKELLDERSPEGLRVVRITSDEQSPASHIYMEAPIFLPDSKRFVLKRIIGGAFGDPKRTRQQFLLCDIQEDCSLRALTDESGVTAPSVAPDGSCMYYIVDQSLPGKKDSRVTLKKVMLDSFKRETLAVIDTPPHDSPAVPSRIYPLSSISPDGKRLCISGFLGDGERDNAPWGLIVFDQESTEYAIVLQGGDFCNMHPQYCRSMEAPRDILVQHNHGCVIDAQGALVKLTGGAGADVHVIRDDGTLFRDMPWGRDGIEFCQGHQCWRGEMTTAVSSMTIREFDPQTNLEAGTCPLVESRPMFTPESGRHTGRNITNAMRNVISRDIPSPGFCHFGFDRTGTKFASDVRDRTDIRENSEVVIGSLDPLPGSALKIQYLLRPRCSWSKNLHSHPHPFLSPDGTRTFFNSDVDGLLQAWMVEGYEFP